MATGSRGRHAAHRLLWEAVRDARRHGAQVAASLLMEMHSFGSLAEWDAYTRPTREALAEQEAARIAQAERDLWEAYLQHEEDEYDNYPELWEEA